MIVSRVFRQPALGICAAFLLTAPVHAAESYWHDDAWSIEKTDYIAEPHCDAVAMRGPGWVAVSFFPISNKAMVSFDIQEGGANFPPGSVQKLNLYFVAPGAATDGSLVDDGWGTADYLVGSQDVSGDERVIGARYSGGETMLDDVAKNASIGFGVAGTTRIIAAYRLTGSAVAMRQLRECGYSLHPQK